jgi:hypothetical protein
MPSIANSIGSCRKTGRNASCAGSPEKGRAGKGRERKGLGRKIIATSARTAAKGMGRKAAL